MKYLKNYTLCFNNSYLQFRYFEQVMTGIDTKGAELLNFSTKFDIATIKTCVFLWKQCEL